MTLSPIGASTSMSSGAPVHSPEASPEIDIYLVMRERLGMLGLDKRLHDTSAAR